MNWKDKYENMKPGQVSWFWHKISDYGTTWWEPVKVYAQRGPDNTILAYYYYSNSSGELLGEVKESNPNGPECVNPDKLMEMLQKNKE